MQKIACLSAVLSATAAVGTHAIRKGIRGKYFLGVLVSLNLLPALAIAQADPFAGSEVLHADALVSAVLDDNPLLPAAQSAWEAAESGIAQAGAFDDPMLSTIAAPKSLGQYGMDPGVGIEFSQRLPWPGKRGLREEIARVEARAVEQMIPNTRLALIVLAKEGFADWYLVHAGLRVNEANRQLWREVKEIAEINYANGMGSQQDVLQADLEYQMLGQREVVLQRQQAEVQAQLNRLLNRSANKALLPPAPLSEPSDLQSLPELRALALLQRTELEAAEAELEADSVRVKLAQREFYPDFELSTAYSSMWSDTTMRWTVGVGINIPLGRAKRRAAVSGALAKETESNWRLQYLALQVREEVEQAHARVEESHHLLALHEDQLLPLARANLDAARTAYQTRTGSLESLLRAERSLYETELNFEKVRAEYYRNMASLERAVGGWDHSTAAVR